MEYGYTKEETKKSQPVRGTWRQRLKNKGDKRNVLAAPRTRYVEAKQEFNFPRFLDASSYTYQKLVSHTESGIIQSEKSKGALEFEKETSNYNNSSGAYRCTQHQCMGSTVYSHYRRYAR